MSNQMDVSRSYHWSRVTYGHTAEGKLRNKLTKDVSANLISQQIAILPMKTVYRDVYISIIESIVKGIVVKRQL